VFGLFESDGFFRVERVEKIEHLPPEARAVLVLGLDDGKLAALSRHPSVETIFTDGNSQATDEGVAAVARLPKPARPGSGLEPGDHRPGSRAPGRGAASTVGRSDRLLRCDRGGNRGVSPGPARA
jgi:hypothetical protein